MNENGNKKSLKKLSAQQQAELSVGGTTVPYHVAAEDSFGGLRSSL